MYFLIYCPKYTNILRNLNCQLLWLRRNLVFILQIPTKLVFVRETKLPGSWDKNTEFGKMFVNNSQVGKYTISQDTELFDALRFLWQEIRFAGTQVQHSMQILERNQICVCRHDIPIQQRLYQITQYADLIGIT